MSSEHYREELRAVGGALRVAESHGSCMVLRFLPGGDLLDRLAAIVHTETQAHPTLAIALTVNPAEVVLTLEATDGDDAAVHALVAAIEGGPRPAA